MRQFGTGSIFQRGKIYYYANQKAKVRASLGTSDYKEACQIVYERFAYLLLENEKKQQESLLIKYEATKKKIEDAKIIPIPLKEILTAYNQILFIVNSGRNQDTAFVTEKFNTSIIKSLLTWLREKHSGIKYMQEISPVIAQEYFIAFVQKGLAIRTYNAHLGQLQTIWKRLSVKAGIKENPWQTIQKKRIHSTDDEGQGHRAFTLEELNVMNVKANGWVKYAIIVGYYSALRLNDTITLKWGEIDFEKAFLKHKCLKTGKKIIIYVPEIITPLQDWKIEQESAFKRECDYIFQEQAEKYLGLRNRMDKPNQKLKPDIYHASKVFRNFLQYDCGFVLKKIGFHSLRVTHATLSRKSGISDINIQKQLGHSSFNVTMGYIQPSTEEKYNDLILNHKSLPLIGQEVCDEIKDFKLKILALNASTLPELKKQIINLCTKVND